MLIGLTYDLRSEYLAAGYGEEETAEFDRPDTIEAIETALQALGHRTDRIGHARQLVARLAAGDRWDLVFNIAEGMHGLGREAQVPALLDLFQIPYTFSDALVMALCLHKGFTKAVVREAGVATPDHALVERLDDLDGVRLPYPLFAKPVAEGTGKGIHDASRIESPGELRRVCGELLEKFRQPILVETYLPGDEFTVGVLGTGRAARVVGAIQVRFNSAEKTIYSYHAKSNWESLLEYVPVTGPIVEAMGEASLRAWRALGGRDAGRMDFRLDAAGRPHFLEVNPLPGLNPVHSDLPILSRLAGLEFNQLIAEIVASAISR